MFVPALKGLPGTENGHRNYQPPSRSADDFGPSMDRFSAWVIYLSLFALSVEPGLWHQLHESGGEYLLLSEDDFKNPRNSARFPALAHHTDPTVRDLAALVQSLVGQPLAVLPELAVAAWQATGTIPSQSQASPSSGGPLPSWMEGHLAAPAASPAAPVGSSGSRPALTFVQRRPRDVAAALLLPLSLVIPLVLVVIHLLASAQVASVLVFTLAAAAVFARQARRARPEFRAAADLRQALRQLEAAAKDRSNARTRIDKERDRLDQEKASLPSVLAAKQQALTTQLQKAHANAEVDRTRQRKAVDQQLAALTSGEQAEIRRELEELQRRYLHEELQSQSIAKAALPQFGPKTIGDMAAYGIKTAADFTGIRLVSSGSYGSTTASIVLANGHAVNIKGIGPQKARTLDTWRQSCQAAALSRPQPVLSPQQRSNIAATYSARRHLLDQALRDLDSTTQRKKSEATQEVASARAALLADQQRQVEALRARRTDLDRQAAAITSVVADQHDLAAARQSLQAHRHEVTVRRYLGFLCTGS